MSVMNAIYVQSEDSEVVLQLKSELEAVNEELEQQKRLNLALVKRKVSCHSITSYIGPYVYTLYIIMGGWRLPQYYVTIQRMPPTSAHCLHPFTTLQEFREQQAAKGNRSRQKSKTAAI